MDSQNKKRILLVEDDTVLANMYRKEFESEGFEVIVATDGKKGEEDALRIKPDIIILDIALPQIDGLTVMKHVRNDPWGETASIIILTNLSINDKIIKNIMEYKPSYCLIKSDTTPADVVSKINDVLSDKTQ